MKTIKISGPKGCGKSRIANLLYGALRDMYPNVRIIDAGWDVSHTRDFHQETNFTIEVIQDGDSLTITTEES